MKDYRKNPLRVVTLCSGYDSQCLALDKLKAEGILDYELIAWSEFDPESKQPLEKQPAVIAHNALYPQWADRNLGDMTKIDWKQVPDFDLLTYSTPCQSISNAGLQKGITVVIPFQYWYMVKRYRIVFPLNPMPDGTCRTLKRQYQQSSTANFFRGGICRHRSNKNSH